MSSLVPKWRQPVGQALMHAGSRPTETRSTQSVHLDIFPVVCGEAGDVERAARLAVPAADALVRVDVDDAVGVLDDRAGRGAGGQAARLVAVHALVLAHQPDDAAVEVALVEADQVPVLRVQRRQGLVGPGLLRRDGLQVVPLLAGDLAGLAADARRRVDVLGNRRHACAAPSGCRGRKRRSGGCRGLVCSSRSSLHAFSSLTRKVLNSGVQVFGSIAEGVRKFASGPVWPVSPAA